MPPKTPPIAIGSPRKRQPVDPEKAAAFEARVEVEEEGRAPLHAVLSPDPAAAAPSMPHKARRSKELRNRKGTVHEPYVRKSDGVATVALTFTVPTELARRLKVHAAMTGVKVSDIGVEALTEYLDTQKA
ncbi:MAG: hypothetical protein AB7P00_10980 [Sandaracinaceae bacterium]